MNESNEYIGIRQFFTRQTFPNPDSSKFSTVKNLCHTVLFLIKLLLANAFTVVHLTSHVTYKHK